MRSDDKYESITDEKIIKTALARVVNSPAFESSKRSRFLLEYVVKKYLSGEVEAINGTAIAQDILGYGADFDASINPVVRVQAGRMRKRLAAYYRQSGADDPVLIYVDKGQYAPNFCKRNLTKLNGHKKLDADKDGNIGGVLKTFLSLQWKFAALMGVAILALGILAIKNYNLRQFHNTSVGKPVSEYPSIAIVPFQNLTGLARNDVFKQGFQQQLASDLHKFRVIRVVITDLAHSQIINAPNKIAAYSLEGSFLSVEDEIDLVVRLIDLKTGETLSQYRISRAIGDDSYFNALSAISSDISSQFAGPAGILAKESLKGVQHDLNLKYHNYKNIKIFECLALFGVFEADKSYENFQYADGCLKYQLSLNPDDSSLLAAQAWIMVYGSKEWNFFEGDKAVKGYTLLKALALAERAVALNPGNNRAYEYMALIQWNMGQKSVAIQSMRRSGNLNSASPNYLANLGQFLCYSGDWPNGMLAAREAIARNPNSPYWYYTPLFVRAVLDGDAQKALTYAKKHEGVSGPEEGTYMLIAAIMAGDTDAIEHYKTIATNYAKNHGGDMLYKSRQWMQAPEILAALEGELTRIGIEFPET